MSDDFELYVANAISWAKDRLGSRDYPLRCLAFVEDAYEVSNNVEIFGGSSAQESADIYGAADNRAADPPLGAFVFYECSGLVDGECKNWGHVGLHVGDGLVIHAWDEVRWDPYLDVERLSPAPTWTPPRYLGWTPVERIFVGYRRKS